MRSSKLTVTALGMGILLATTACSETAPERSPESTPTTVAIPRCALSAWPDDRMVDGIQHFMIDPTDATSAIASVQMPDAVTLMINSPVSLAGGKHVAIGVAIVALTSQCETAQPSGYAYTLTPNMTTSDAFAAAPTGAFLPDAARPS